MKKIISVLAMALLVIGAAQAQNQTKKMVIQLKNGQVVKYNTEYVEDVTFEIIDLPDVPTTIEEAKAILVGYWKVNEPLDDDNIEGEYFIITEDLKALVGYKYKDSFTDDYGEISPYAGKYVAIEMGEVTFTSEDPTTFSIAWGFGTNLQLNSFDFTVEDVTKHLVRVEPFEYILLGGV